MVKFPNFFIIGAAKCGTTALCLYLKQHPSIFMCPMKEPKFFANVNAPPHWLGPGDEQYERNTVTTLAAYAALFHNADDERALGEASTQYLYIERAAHEIKRYVPHAKLIAILRNPADAAYAAFMHKRRENLEPLRDFARALGDEPNRERENWSPFWFYRQRGLYYEHLMRYYSLFPKEQIRVYLYEDFAASPAKLLQDIFNLLGVEESFAPDMAYRPNISGIPRSRALHRLLMSLKPWQRVLEGSPCSRVLGRAVAGLKDLNLARPQMDSEVRAQLLKGYREEIQKLEELLSRDLSHWLRDAPCV
jgi:hypothetical protein